jgi:hypothetical protein
VNPVEVSLNESNHFISKSSSAISLQPRVLASTTDDTNNLNPVENSLTDENHFIFKSSTSTASEDKSFLEDPEILKEIEDAVLTRNEKSDQDRETILDINPKLLDDAEEELQKVIIC